MNGHVYPHARDDGMGSASVRFRLEPTVAPYVAEQRFQYGRVRACTHHAIVMPDVTRKRVEKDDPIGYQGGINLYGYSNCNPLTFVGGVPGTQYLIIVHE